MSQRIGTAPLILGIVFNLFGNGYRLEVSFDSDVPLATLYAKLRTSHSLNPAKRRTGPAPKNFDTNVAFGTVPRLS